MNELVGIFFEEGNVKTIYLKVVNHLYIYFLTVETFLFFALTISLFFVVVVVSLVVAVKSSFLVTQNITLHSLSHISEGLKSHFPHLLLLLFVTLNLVIFKP